MIEISEWINLATTPREIKIVFYDALRNIVLRAGKHIWALSRKYNKDLTGSQTFDPNYENDKPTIHWNTNSNVRNDKTIEVVRSRNRDLMRKAIKLYKIINSIQFNT
jgi:hypothetical protein